MHEYSIVQSLLDLCEQNAGQHNAKAISKVTVKIGTLSGVEPELLKSAFDTFKEKTICDSALFHIDIQPPVIRCRACGKESTLDALEHRCPVCQSEDVTLIDGDEMYLMSLEME